MTPTVAGIPVPEGCGEYYFNTYGIVQAYQTGTGFIKDPVDRVSGDSWGDILNLATNDDKHWSNGEAGGTWLQAGPMTICVTYPWLTTWRCQNGSMDTAGKLNGIGTNAQGYDLAK